MNQMLEVERLVNTGILPYSFFCEETICDYFVSSKMKRIWGVIYDLLVQFDSICRKHNLNYVLSYGALLGVIRHDGFIPWDDDLDVCMPRDDYERFLMVAPFELSAPYFLQIPGEDNGYYFSFAKLRNSNTSGISLPFIYEKFNQGLGLDIFVLDNCNLSTSEDDFETVKKLALENSANMRRSLRYPTKSDMDRIDSFPKRDPQIVLNEMLAVMTNYNNTESDYCVNLSTTVYPVKKMIYEWKDILDTIDKEMYGRMFKIPRNYDEILKITYGDYMQFPSLEKRGVWHSTTLLNPDIPYKELLCELREQDKLNNNDLVI